MFTSTEQAFQYPYLPNPMAMATAAAMDPSGRWSSTDNHQPIIAPNCPRCASSNTKFCYYNNYSLAQPRYFCKGCRRYWTKGGSLRNVPVGGGCRKSRRSRSSKANQNRGSGGQDDPSGPNRGGGGADSSDGSGGGWVDIDLAAVFARYLNQDKSGGGSSSPPSSSSSQQPPCAVAAGGEADRSDSSENQYCLTESECQTLQSNNDLVVLPPPKEFDDDDYRQLQQIPECYEADQASIGGRDQGSASCGGGEVGFWDPAEMILADDLWSSPEEAVGDGVSALSADFTCWPVQDLGLPPLLSEPPVLGGEENGRFEGASPPPEDALLGDFNWNCFDLAGYEIFSRP